MEPSILDLQPVIVTASREKQPRREAPIAITQINATQIKDTKATALYQLLNKVAGVYMVNLGNEQHTMAIRQLLPITRCTYTWRMGCLFGPPESLIIIRYTRSTCLA